jgi:hypothetical protein
MKCDAARQRLSTYTIAEIMAAAPLRLVQRWVFDVERWAFLLYHCGLLLGQAMKCAQTPD